MAGFFCDALTGGIRASYGGFSLARALRLRKHPPICRAQADGEEMIRRKRISSDELIWRIHEELASNGQSRLSLAVVPDSKLGFRVIVARRNQLLPSLRVRLLLVEKRLQKEYAVR